MNVTQVLGVKGILPTSGAAVSRARTSLNMYNEPPNEMVTLEDFEVLAFDRLKGTVQLQRGVSHEAHPHHACYVHHTWSVPPILLISLVQL